MHVVCVGDLMVDLVTKLPGPLALGSDTPAVIDIRGGGSAANVAVWLTATGADATFVGRIGDDHAGLRAVDELTAAGVVPMVEIDPARATGLCIVLVDEHGERTMIPSAGANDASADADLLPVGADVLYVSGYALLNRGSRPFALAALDVARQRGWAITVDAASAAPLAAAPEFLDWIGRDLLMLANTDEARVLTGLADPHAAVRSLGARCGAAIVKLGAAGAMWSDGTGVHVAPAPRVAVVDSTGAGDAFAAGFLATGGDVPTRLAAAVATAAQAVVQLGARPTSYT